MSRKVIPEDIRDYLAYDPLTGVLTWRKSVKDNLSASIKGKISGCLTPQGYLITRFRGSNYLNHRLAYFFVYGYCPDYIDHIDRNKTNNRITNLREASKEQNSMNVALCKNNTSGVTGVSWRKHSLDWRAYIMVNRRQIHLGVFTTLKAAVFARKQAERKYFKEYRCK